MFFAAGARLDMSEYPDEGMCCWIRVVELIVREVNGLEASGVVMISI